MAELQKQQSNFQNKNNQQLSNPATQKEFNWLYVVIPLGVIVLIFGGIILYLLGKKKS